MDIAVEEFCDFLSLRALPGWIIDQIRIGSEEECALAQPSGEKFFTDHGLAKLGIAHPLHRRRILRELECLHQIKHPESVAAKSGCTSRPTTPSECSQALRDLRDLQQLCLKRPRRRARRRSFEQDMRWPFLLIECFPQNTQNTASKAATEPSDYASRGENSHARRRQMKASTLFGASDSTDTQAEAPMTAQSTQRSSAAGDQQKAELYGRLDGAEHFPELEEPEEVEEEEEDDVMGWDAWLQSRLHSWGMLSLVDDVLHAACKGNLSVCTDMMDKVAMHGGEFQQSLAKTPLPSYIHAALVLPPHVVAPANIWDWLLWRLDLLEEAEYRITTLLGKASNLLDSIMGASGRGPMRTDSVKQSSTDRRRTVNVKKLMQVQGMLTLQTPETPARSNSNQPSRNNSVGSQPPGRSSSVNSNTDGASEKSGPKMSGFQRFKKIASLVLSHVRAKKQDGMVLNTKLLTCISMQTKVTQTQDELAALLKEVDEWPPLISQSRGACEEMRGRLREASQTLFERFVDLRQHIEVELREVTLGDQGIVDCPQLEGKIIDTQRELSSSLLLGDFALQRADQLGVSLRAQGIEPPPNPWEGCVQLVEPPWEGSFLRALRKLEPLKRNLNVRRQGTTYVDSVLHSASEKRRSLKTPPKHLRAGLSIPEDLLAVLREHIDNYAGYGMTVPDRLDAVEPFLKDLFEELRCRCEEEKMQYDLAGQSPSTHKANFWLAHTDPERISGYIFKSRLFLQGFDDFRCGGQISKEQLRFAVLVQHFVSQDTLDFQRTRAQRMHDDVFEGR
ncbi:Smyd3 [Symbiodinium sp. CCMP2592]|nr:Smyd3 [Symbiodinium sp. CCMP2592]